MKVLKNTQSTVTTRERKSEKDIPPLSKVYTGSKILIFGTSVYSPWEISEQLRALNVSHTVDPIERTRRVRVVDLGFAQPKAVHLSTRLTGFRKQAVNFIVASHGELADTNFKRFGEQPSLPEVLKRLLTADVSRHGVIPEVRSLKAADYVGLLAKPSILNKIQTEVYKIQPYTLRKETQTLILRFFNGLVTLTEVLKILDKSMKTEKIKPLIKEGVSLRDAVLMLKRKSAEEVEAETGMLSFDLLYLSRARR